MSQKRKHISLQVTEQCNLNCIYCFQKHEEHEVMKLDVAKQAIISNIRNAQSYDEVEIELIGGEAFLRTDFVVELCEWAWSRKFCKPIVFFITTNGILIHGQIKQWLKKNSKSIILALSLDGTPKTHNYNRSNSYNKIDIDFFRHTWPTQPIKMTISHDMLSNLSEDIIHIHNLGFLSTANFAYGIDWTSSKDKEILQSELKKLCDYYISHTEMQPNSLLDMPIDRIMHSEEIPQKWCGVGTDIIAIDRNGIEYPCPMFFPSSMSESTDWRTISFTDETKFESKECLHCPIKCICPTCYGISLIQYNKLTTRDPNLCEFTKIRALAVSYMNGIKISQDKFVDCSPEKLADTIKAIKIIQEAFSGTC